MASIAIETRKFGDLPELENGAPSDALTLVHDGDGVKTVKVGKFALPGCSGTDNGKFLQVIDGSWGVSEEPLPIEQGGTGGTTAASARKALGLGNTSGALPIANGGTGATTAASARNALGLGNTTGALPIANGGTGATTAAGAVSNLMTTTTKTYTLNSTYFNKTSQDIQVVACGKLRIATMLGVIKANAPTWSTIHVSNTVLAASERPPVNIQGAMILTDSTHELQVCMTTEGYINAMVTGNDSTLGYDQNFYGNVVWTV